MRLEYLDLHEIKGPLVVLKGIKDASYEEMVELTLKGGEKRTGRIIRMTEELCPRGKAIALCFGIDGCELFGTGAVCVGCLVIAHDLT